MREARIQQDLRGGCHGGSETPVEFLANMVHERATAEVPGKPAQPDYYLFSKTLSPGTAAAKYSKDPVLEVGHGGEIETALNLACRPDLVHLDRVTEDGPTNRRAVSANYHIEWINQVPLAYVGDPRFASLETADKIMEAIAADFIQAAKEIAAYEIGSTSDRTSVRPRRNRTVAVVGGQLPLGPR